MEQTRRDNVVGKSLTEVYTACDQMEVTVQTVFMQDKTWSLPNDGKFMVNRATLIVDENNNVVDVHFQ